MTGDNGSTVFIVEGLVDGNWKEIFKSDLIKGTDIAQKIKVEFPKGMKKLRLTTTDGNDMHWNDHAIWADAKFYK